MTQTLSGKERRELRGRGHHLRPAAFVGKEGLSPNVLKCLADALKSTDLVKVKVLDTTGIDRKKFAVEIAEALGAQVAQVLGKTMLLFRPVPVPEPAPEPDSD
jgi:RNA-binding protein